MKRLAVLGIAFSVILSIAYAGITLYDEYLSFGRMWETPAVKPHEEPLLVMAEGTVPVDGGEAALRVGQGDRLEDPDPDRSMKRMFAGKTVYDRYCIHCHGKALDGQGTVWQSFSPLAQDLGGTAPISRGKRASGLLRPALYPLTPERSWGPAEVLARLSHREAYPHASPRPPGCTRMREPDLRPSEDFDPQLLRLAFADDSEGNSGGPTFDQSRSSQ